MKSLLLSLAIVATAFSAASADPIADRKALMKERGGLVGQIAPMVKGEQPFDAAKVQEVFAALEANAAKFDVAALFPETSKEGDTAASPKIWEDMAGFKAAADKFAADVGEAAASKPQDVDALKAAFGKVVGNCGACHEAFRVKKG
jgi:cytochrome c556